MRKNRKLLIIAAVFLLLIIVITINSFNLFHKTKQTKVGFVMSGSMTEAGWNGMHYEGVKKACDKYSVELLVKENVEEFSGQCETAIRELAEEGVQMIILSSYGYSEEVREVVKEFPDIVFNVNSSEYHDENMTSYFVRMYQARYLSGMLAGLRTKSNVIGYVAAMPNNEVNRGISAFTLGVRRVNPQASVVVSWTGEWDNKEKEVEAANQLIKEKNADILTYHQNQSNVVDAAESAGVDSIGYHQALSGYSSHYLTSVTCNWEVMYSELIGEFLQGHGNTVQNYWLGIEKDVVGLSAYSELVTDEMQTVLETAQNEILMGKDVFSGTIYDNEGTLRCDDTESISDEMLLEHFDWYVEGVNFYEEDAE